MRNWMFSAAALVLASAVSQAARAADVTIHVDAAKTAIPIGKEHYGVFLEEIGHGVDGGLYGEMLQNRAFEDAKAPEGFTYQQGGRGRGSGFRGADTNGGKWVNPGGYATTFIWAADKSLPYWSLVNSGGATGNMSLDMTHPVDPATPASCKLEITSVPDGGLLGIANEGWCRHPNSSAVGVTQGETYELSFYARGENFTGTLQASVNAFAGGADTSIATVSGITSEWKQYKATFTATKTDGTARFVLAAQPGSHGTLWLDMVSLFPSKTFKGRPNGLRPDIAQMIADMKPGFVRFPGGCVVEAATVETSYNWKNSIGPVLARPECWSAWDYRRTHGMGMYEYLQFIEDIGATPLYVGFAGQTCVYRAPAVVPANQIQPYVDAFTDLIDYANGPATSKWGKLRAESGHPASFNLHLMEIGNENTGAEYTRYYGMIYKAIKDAHPEVQTIADIPMRGQPVEMIDDHHYADPNYFVNTTFDTRSRTQPPLYLGEVADTAPQYLQRGNLGCALAEGVYLMNGEKNADVVKMVSYAPLLGHENGLNELAGSPPPWHAMIYFDSTRIFGTASYYLWKTFGINRPSINLQTQITAAAATNSITGNIGVGSWGTNAEFKDIKVEKDGKTLYESDFTKPDATQGWQVEGGRWGVVDGAYRQTSQNTNCVSYFGDESWTDYTLTMKARKLSGGEGFLVAFGHKGVDKYWWNLGGYGNTQTEIELNQAIQGDIVRGQNLVETNRWYDVKIVVKGMNIQCFLDGKLLHNFNATAPSGPLSALAGRDDATGDIIIKVINRQTTAMSATIDLAGATVDTAAKLTTLAGRNQNDNNSYEAPNRIIPVDSTLTIAGAKFDHEFPPLSFSVLRLTPRK